MTQVVKHYGVSKIIVLDIVEDRLKLAQELGTTVIVNPMEQGPEKAIREATDGLGLMF